MLLKRQKSSVCCAPSQNGTHEAGSSSFWCPSPEAGPATRNWVKHPTWQPTSISDCDFDFGLKVTPIRLRNLGALGGFQSFCVSSLNLWLFCLFSFHCFQVLFVVSFPWFSEFLLNICICWAIAYFFNPPTPV